MVIEETWELSCGHKRFLRLDTARDMIPNRGSPLACYECPVHFVRRTPPQRTAEQLLASTHPLYGKNR